MAVIKRIVILAEQRLEAAYDQQRLKIAYRTGDAEKEQELHAAGAL